MDQLRGPGKCTDGPPGGEGSLRDRFATSEVAGKAARGRGPKRRSHRNRTRVARISRKVICQLASARCFCVRGSDSSNKRWQIQKDRAPRTVRRLEVEDIASSTLLTRYLR